MPTLTQEQINSNGYFSDAQGPLYGSNSYGPVYHPGFQPTTSQSDSILASLYSSDTPEGALAWLKENNPEVYYQMLAERDQNRAYWEDYKKYQENYYSLQKQSLLKAGMNPWLALQNFGSIGTGTVGSSSSVNPTNTLKAQREAKQADLDAKALGAGLGLIGGIIGALIIALL